MESILAEEFIAQSIYRMEEKLTHVEKALAQVSEEDIWKRPNPHSNTIGNILIHLCGNITQYIISSLGEIEDVRQRDNEFAAEGGMTKAELLAKLQSTVIQANQIIRGLDRARLLEIRSVQAYQFSAIGIIIHVVEHFSYHTGQIAFWVKLLKDVDLGFFAGVDLNKKNVHGDVD
ncbi:MAG: DinB family protein [Saprospiraceae bacterium]